MGREWKTIRISKKFPCILEADGTTQLVDCCVAPPALFPKFIECHDLFLFVQMHYYKAANECLQTSKYSEQISAVPPKCSKIKKKKFG